MKDFFFSVLNGILKLIEFGRERTRKLQCGEIRCCCWDQWTGLCEMLVPTCCCAAAVAGLVEMSSAGSRRRFCTLLISFSFGKGTAGVQTEGPALEMEQCTYTYRTGEVIAAWREKSEVVLMMKRLLASTQDVLGTAHMVLPALKWFVCHDIRCMDIF